MNAPDKIYIDDLAVVNDCITKIGTTPLPNFSEYIRKDALLEWAKKENLRFNQIGNEQDDYIARGIAAGFGFLISKLGLL